MLVKKKKSEAGKNASELVYVYMWTSVVLLYAVFGFEREHCKLFGEEHNHVQKAKPRYIIEKSLLDLSITDFLLGSVCNDPRLKLGVASNIYTMVKQVTCTQSSLTNSN